MNRALEQRGHKPTVVQDPKSAREALATAEFDAVVCDIVLPNESGLQVLRDIRENKPTMAIVAISGGKVDGRSMHIDVLHLAQRLGADAIVKKPFDMPTFVSTVETTMAQKKAAPAAASA